MEIRTTICLTKSRSQHYEVDTKLISVDLWWIIYKINFCGPQLNNICFPVVGI